MRTRGNYYATAHETRDNGKRYGIQVARQARTQKDAMRALEATGLSGYVQLWVESEQRRHIIAERDEAGNWWSRDPFHGTMRAMEIPA